MKRLIRFVVLLATISSAACRASTPNMEADIFAQEIPVFCKKIINYKLREHQEVYVHHVADGDTFTACALDGTDAKIKVRLLGIDCPESRENRKCQNDGKEGREGCAEQIPKGIRASKHVESLIAQKMVWLESPGAAGVFEADTHGRTLAYVRLSDGRDLGMSLIDEGFCQDYSWRFPHSRQDSYKNVAH